jgi:hypothetical protein
MLEILSQDVHQKSALAHFVWFTLDF